MSSIASSVAAKSAKRIVVVGGVAGGASFAARMRRLDENAEITLLEKGEFVSFANCGLPYHIGGVIQERDKLLVQSAAGLRNRFRLDVRPLTEVIGVDTNAKTLTIKSETGATSTESYDYLVLSPGAQPIVPPSIFSSAEEMRSMLGSRVFTLRSIPDMDKIKSAVDSSKSCLVIGGGFIGVEVAENLVERGLQVTLAEALPQVLAPFDKDIANYAHREMSKHGIKFALGDGIVNMKMSADGSKVLTTLRSGKTVETDMAVLSIGVAPDTNFLKGSGLKFGPKGHLVVNEKLETNMPGVYAVGDAIEVTNFVSQTPAAIPLAGPANKQGRIAADEINGDIKSVFKGTQGTSIVKVFDLTMAATGLNSNQLRALGKPFQYVLLHPQSSAGYYPGAKQMTIKLLFDPTNNGKILGAQAVGPVGVDKRIDVIATAMRFGGTVSDLTELELCYAPPYSSAKDPVNFAGYIAQNVLSGKVKIFTVEDLAQLDPNRTILLDVRTPTENAAGTIPGAINIPVDALRSRLGELDKSKEIWAFCQVGLRGYIASRILSQNGFNVKNLTGGYLSYNVAQFKSTSL